MTWNDVTGSDVTGTWSHMTGNDRVWMPGFFPALFSYYISSTKCIIAHPSKGTTPFGVTWPLVTSSSLSVMRNDEFCTTTILKLETSARKLMDAHEQNILPVMILVRARWRHFRSRMRNDPNPLAISLKSYLSCPSILLPLDIQYTVYSVSIKWRLKTPK